MSIEKKGINLNKSKLMNFYRNASVLSILGALIILCILWSFISPYFDNNNFINIGTYISANGILAGLTAAMLWRADLSHMAAGFKWHGARYKEQVILQRFYLYLTGCIVV